MYVCVSYLCVSVCERAYYISGTTRPFFSKFLLCPEREAKCCDDRVCVCVCVCVFVRDPIFGTNKTSDLHEFFFAYVTYGRGSVPLWRRSDTSRTSGVMDDVTSAHKPIAGSLGLGYKRRVWNTRCRQRTHGTTAHSGNRRQHRGRSLRSMTALLNACYLSPRLGPPLAPLRFVTCFRFYWVTYVCTYTWSGI